MVGALRGWERDCGSLGANDIHTYTYRYGRGTDGVEINIECLFLTLLIALLCVFFLAVQVGPLGGIGIHVLVGSLHFIV